MGDSPDKGYVRAHIESGEGFFDAGAYSFFGDMAPLDEGLGGALEDGLEAPPEELPAEERGLDDEEDLPIEDLLDTDEDEDLSLAALLRKRIQEGEAGSSQASNGLSKVAAKQEQQQPLMPPLPPQPQMLSSLGQQHTSALLTNQQQQAQYHQQQQQQQQREYAAAAAAAAAASAPPPRLPDAAAFDAVVPAPGSTPMRGKITAQTTPSNVMTAEELEARMLRSAEAPAPSSDSRGTQLLSMLKGGAAPDQQQRHASPMHAQDPALTTAQHQMQQMHMGGTSAPMMPPHPGMGPAMFPHGPPPPHLLQQQQQLGPGMMPPPHPGMGPGLMPPPEVLAQMQQQQQRPPMMPGQQPPPFMGPPSPHQPGGPMGQMPGVPGMGMMGPGGPTPFQGLGPPGRPMGMPPQGMPPQSMPPPHQQQQMQMGMPPPGPYGFGPRGPPLMGPGGVPLGGPMDGQQQRPGMMPSQMRPGQEFMQGPGAPPLPGQLMPPGGPQPLPSGPPQQPGQGFKQQGMPPPGFPGLPASMQQQQQQRHGSPAGMHPGGPHMQQQQGQPGGPQLPLWAGPGPAGTPGASPPMPQHHQQQQQGGAGAGSGAVFGGEYLPTATTASADAMRVVSPAALVHKLRTSGSTWMAADDINYILRIQHMATHSGVPYVEDFYFQAFCNKYFGGRNALIFAPQQLRELGSELQSELEPRFADLAGLGRVVLSNIRTPKMLMDVGSGSKAADTANQDQQQQEQTGAEASKARPLEQEPMLAARIMVEDCMLLLCDVEDIDRMFAATAAAGAAHASGMQLGPHTPGPISPALAQGLLQRRAALLGGIAASFRLPDAPLLPAAAGDVAAGAVGDRVFIRILALPKGRSLITKTLKLMFTPPPAAANAKGSAGRAAAPAPVNGTTEAGTTGSSSSSSTGLDVIWALLRNAQLAFGPPLVGSVTEAEKRLTDSTIALAAIASEMVKRLTKPEEAVACLAAAIAGLSAPTTASGHDAAAASNGNTSSCQLLPLYPSGRVPVGTSPEWLGSILGSLLLRASELGLGSFAAAAATAAKGLGDGTPGEAELLEQQAEGNGAAPEVAAEWQRLLGEFVQLVQLHLWQLVQAVRGAAAEVAAAAAAGPGSSEVLLASVPKMACVPLMRVLMAHCSEEQQEQLKGYLSEVGR